MLVGTQKMGGTESKKIGKQNGCTAWKISRAMNRKVSDIARRKARLDVVPKRKVANNRGKGSTKRLTVTRHC